MLRTHIRMVLLREDMTRSRDRGATAVEYGLIVALIAVVIIVAVTLLGGRLSNIFNNTANSLP
ncbi:MAG: Flp family type IVb pilin [Actinobacteria bacterium]|nr:Flp family type IVb pilin [Actinomycetota bacterium]